MNARHRLVVVALLAAPACGGNTGNDSSALTAEEFPQLYAAAFCELTSRCCAFSGGEPRRDECETDVVAEQRAGANAATRAGARFDARTAESCLAELERHDSCEIDPLNALASFLPSCQVWHGDTPADGACRLNLECTREGDYPLSCVEDRCQHVESLFPGSDCDPRDSTAVCSSGFSRCDAVTLRCEPLPRAGEACADDCHVEARCSEGVCQKLGTEGGDCMVGSDCHDGLCIDGGCASGLAGHHCAVPE